MMEYGQIKGPWLSHWETPQCIRKLSLLLSKCVCIIPTAEFFLGLWHCFSIWMSILRTNLKK